MTGGFTWNVGDPLYVSVSNDGTIFSAFGSFTQTNKELGMLRWNGTSWAVTDLGRPTGHDVCDSVAAAQGNLDSVGFNPYRVVVVCTSHDASAAIYVATATSKTSTTFTWTSHSLPNFVCLACGQIVAATIRKSGTFTKAIDAFVRVDGGFSRLTVTLASTTLTALGDAYEADTTSGGMVAVDASGNLSRVFYNAELSSARYLYERRSNSTNFPKEYRNNGRSAAPVTQWSTNNYYAEGKTSTYHGTTAITLMRRPGTGGTTDWPTVSAFWSNSDGASTGPGIAITDTVTIGGNSVVHDYLADPTVSISDTKTAYYVQLGEVMDDCAGTSLVYRGTVYMTTTSDGTNFSTPVVLRTLVPSPTTSPPLDHPFADIERKAGGNDILHVTWWDTVNNNVEYVPYTESVGLGSVVNLSMPTGEAPPRITAADSGRVIVSVPTTSGTVRICELAGITGCNSAGWQLLPVGQNYGFGDVPVSSGNVMRTRYATSFAYSATEDVLYYCFQKRETNGDFSGDADFSEEFDVYCSRGTRDGVTFNYSWSTPVAVTATNDDRDQFLPEVSVTADASNYDAYGTVLVTWYDRADSTTNYEYEAMKTISIDGGATYLTPVTAFVNQPLSDPDDLPRHCQHSDVRFIGDFAAVEPDIFHSLPLFVMANLGSVGTTVMTDFFALGSWQP